jgi:hypothetical protein
VNPPAEQLIRDYLNRVSVAARGRLSPDDRRAFVARTRELIEQNTRGAGQVSPMGVAQFLNGLGDPAALVARERDRLAGQPPGTSPGSPAGGTPRRSRTAAGERRPRSGAGAWIGRLRPPAAPLSGVPVPRPAEPDGTAPDGTAPDGTALDGTSPDGAAPDGVTAASTASPGAAAGRRPAAPRTVLVGDVVTGYVPTGNEPPPGPASESISRPVPAEVRPGSGRAGWPFQAMNGTGADPVVSANGHGPASPGAGPEPAAAEPAAAEPARDSAAGFPDAPLDAATGPAGPSEPGEAGPDELSPVSSAEPAAEDGPAAGSAPVIGRWAGGTPVTGDLTALSSPGAANGRAPVHGHEPAASGLAASDFTTGDVTDSDVPARPGPAGPAATRALPSRRLMRWPVIRRPTMLMGRSMITPLRMRRSGIRRLRGPRLLLEQRPRSLRMT